MITMDGLTKDEIKEIADRLDNCLGDNFHDLCVNAVGYTEISDSDVYEIKKELALGYLEEWSKYQKDEANIGI